MNNFVNIMNDFIGGYGQILFITLLNKRFIEGWDCEFRSLIAWVIYINVVLLFDFWIAENLWRWSPNYPRVNPVPIKLF